MCGECHFHGEKLEIFLKNQRWDVDGCSVQEMVLYQFFLQRFVRSNIAMSWGISQGETPMELPVWPFSGNEPGPFLTGIEMGTPVGPLGGYDPTFYHSDVFGRFFSNPMWLFSRLRRVVVAHFSGHRSQFPRIGTFEQNQRPPSLPTTYGLAHSVP